MVGKHPLLRGQLSATIAAHSLMPAGSDSRPTRLSASRGYSEIRLLMDSATEGPGVGGGDGWRGRGSFVPGLVRKRPSLGKSPGALFSSSAWREVPIARGGGGGRPEPCPCSMLCRSNTDPFFFYIISLSYIITYSNNKRRLVWLISHPPCRLIACVQ